MVGETARACSTPRALLRPKQESHPCNSVGEVGAISTERKRSLIDELVEGDHNERPAYLQAALRRIANRRFLTTAEKHQLAHNLLETADSAPDD